MSALEYSQIVLLDEDLAFTWQVFRFIDSLIPWWSEVESGGIVVAALSSASGEIKARSMVEELPLGTWRVGSLMTWYKKKLEVTETNLEYKVLLWLQKSILKSPTKIKFVKKEVLRENKVSYKEFLKHHKCDWEDDTVDKHKTYKNYKWVKQ